MSYLLDRRRRPPNNERIMRFKNVSQYPIYFSDLRIYSFGTGQPIVRPGVEVVVFNIDARKSKQLGDEIDSGNCSIIDPTEEPNEGTDTDFDGVESLKASGSSSVLQNDVTLVAGSGVTIVQNDSLRTLTISSSTGSGLTGSGSANRLAYWTGVGDLSFSSTLQWSGTVLTAPTFTATTGFSGNGSSLTNLSPTAISSGTAGINISGNAANITGNIPISQVTNLSTTLSGLVSKSGDTITGPLVLSGSLTISTGAANGYVWTSNAVGLGSWQAPSVGSSFIDLATPTGTINGSNVSFTLASTPAAGSLHLYLNGLLQRSGGSNDYTLSGVTITMSSAPTTGSVLLASYRV